MRAGIQGGRFQESPREGIRGIQEEELGTYVRELWRRRKTTEGRESAARETYHLGPGTQAVHHRQELQGIQGTKGGPGQCLQRQQQGRQVRWRELHPVQQIEQHQAQRPELRYLHLKPFRDEH